MTLREDAMNSDAYPVEIRADLAATASNLAIFEWRAWIAAIVLLTLIFVTATFVKALIEVLLSTQIGELGGGFVLAVVGVPFTYLWSRIWRHLVNWVLINRRDEVLRVHLALHPSADRPPEQAAPSDGDKPSD
jgi:hypothetical protein